MDPAVASGLPPLGAETASSNGLALDVSYRDAQDRQVDPVDVLRDDVTISIAVTNKMRTPSTATLSLLLPGSCEPLNARVFARRRTRRRGRTPRRCEAPRRTATTRTAVTTGSTRSSA